MTDIKELSLGEAYFVQFHQPKFGIYQPADEELHREGYATRTHYALTETQYYGFFVPEKNIHCFTWIWYHPNLNTLTAGTMAWSGIKKFALGCELFDFRAFMSGNVFAKSFTDFELDNGLRVKMAEPGKQFHLQYRDDARQNSFDVVQRAVSDVIMWPTNNHFEQVMKCEGEITLRGERHKVDCFSIRDRSFNENRLEDPMPIPPNNWVTGAFGEDLSFCVVGMEDPSLNPMWRDKFSVPGDSTLRFGWMVMNGESIAVQKAQSRIDYDMDTLLPRSIVLTITDVEERVFHLTGTIAAATPLTAWMNVRCPICLVKWDYQGRSGVGEIQCVQFNDFVHAYS